MSIFEQWRVHASDECIVTFTEHCGVERTVVVGDEIILEPDSPIVWFTFPEQWHDIGRFHRADGTFTGLYANILTPIQFAGELSWSTTDLFLDVWFSAVAGPGVLLDEDELAQALRNRWISATEEAGAVEEAVRLQSLHRAGAWPPRIVAEWTLDRARAALRG